MDSADYLCWNGRIHSIAAALFAKAKRNEEAKSEEDKALEWLRKSVSAGFRDAAELANDTFFEGLRDREDFKALVESLSNPKESPPIPKTDAPLAPK